MAAHPDELVVTLGPPGGAMTDVTAWVEGVRVQRGRSDPLNRYRAGTCDLSLANDDGRFSPWNAESPIGPILPGWVLQVGTGAGDSVYKGFVSAVRETIARTSHRRALVQCVDGFARLAMARDEAVTPVGATELPGARIDRILDAAGWSDTDRNLDTGNPALDATTLSDPALDEIADVVDSEPGWFLIDRSGLATFWESDHTSSAWTSARWTFSHDPSGAELPYVACYPTADDDLIVNRVIVTNLDNETTVVEDATSIAAYGVRTWVRSGLYFDVGSHGSTVGQAVLDRSADSLTRIESVDLCATLGATDAASGLWDVCATVELHDRVAVETVVGAVVVTWQAYVETITHEITPHQWQVKLGLGPAITGTTTSTIAAVTSLTADPTCTAVRLDWRLTGTAVAVDVKIEVNPAGLGTGTWIRYPGGTRSITWHGLTPNEDYRVSVRVVGGSGVSSTTTADFTTDSCTVPDIDPPTGDIEVPPSTGIDCGTGWTRKIQWIVSVLDLSGEIGATEIGSGLSPDDGTNIRDEMGAITFTAGQAYRVCTRVVCQHNTLGTIVVHTDYGCADWVEPATWLNSCARTAGDDWQLIADDEDRGGAVLWLDWCPGPIDVSAKTRDPATLAVTATNTGPGVAAIAAGPTSATSDPSLAAYSGGALSAAVLAWDTLTAVAFDDTTDDLAITCWVNIGDWSLADPVIPIVSIGDGFNLLIRRTAKGKYRWSIETKLANGTWWESNATPTQHFTGDAWHRIDVVWDYTTTNNYTIDIDGTTRVSGTALNALILDGTDYWAVAAPPFGKVGQVMVWDALVSGGVLDNDEFANTQTLIGSTTDIRGLTWARYGASAVFTEGSGGVMCSTGPMSFTNADIAYTDQGVSDCVITCEITAVNVNSQRGDGICFRVGSSGVNGFLAFIYRTVSNQRFLYVQRYDAGTLTGLKTGTTDFGSSGVITLTVTLSGSSVTVDAATSASGATDQYTGTQTNHQTNTRHGITGYGGASTGNPHINRWEIST